MGLTRGQEINYKNLNNAFVSAIGGGNLIGDYTINGILNAGHHILSFEQIEINALGTGDRNSYIDFHSDDTHTDYSARIIRAPGENSDFKIVNLGSGNIEIESNNNIYLKTNGSFEAAVLKQDEISILQNSGKIISYSTRPAEGSLIENSYFSIGSGASRRIEIFVSNDGYTKAEIKLVNNNTANGDIYFLTSNSSAAPVERVRIKNNGITLIQSAQIVNEPHIEATSMRLNYNRTAHTSYIYVDRSGSSNAAIRWNESTLEWEVGIGSNIFPIFSGLNAKKQARFYFGSTNPTHTNRLNYDGYFYATKVYNAVYNDLAEFMEFTGEAEPGDVMVQIKNNLVKSSKRAMPNVIGVYSDSFGFALGADNKENKIPIGLSGKVKVKLYGKIKAGQELVSYKNGQAIKANIFEKLFRRSAIIGKALEDGENTRIWILIK